jgi:hypothetical protein
MNVLMTLNYLSKGMKPMQKLIKMVLEQNGSRYLLKIYFSKDAKCTPIELTLKTKKELRKYGLDPSEFKKHLGGRWYAWIHLDVDQDVNLVVDDFIDLT